MKFGTRLETTRLRPLSPRDLPPSKLCVGQAIERETIKSSSETPRLQDAQKFLVSFDQSIPLQTRQPL